MGLRRRARFALATSRALAAAVEHSPALRARAWRSARRYVAGPDVADALAVARELAGHGLGSSLDLFGERVTARAAGARVAAAYEELGARLAGEDARTWLSLDLSHIAFSGQLLARIATAVPRGRRLQVGAEEAAVTGTVLDLVLGAAADGLPVEVTLQANLRRSEADAARLAAAGVPVRLVKGAYVEAPAAARPWGAETDRAYAELARALGAAGLDVALATHDAALRSALLAELPTARCELLLGVGGAEARALAAAGRDVRLYVPYGPDWLRYLMRRRAEAQGTR